MFIMIIREFWSQVLNKGYHAHVAKHSQLFSFLIKSYRLVKRTCLNHILNDYMYIRKFPLDLSGVVESITITVGVGMLQQIKVTRHLCFKHSKNHCQNCWISYPRKSSKFLELLLFLNQEIFCGFPLQGKAETATIN